MTAHGPTWSDTESPDPNAKSDAAPLVENRVPPHDLRAEAAVISACMVDHENTGVFELVAELVNPTRFYSTAHTWIWTGIEACHAAKRPSDVVTVATWLKDHDRLAQVGGMAYLTEVLNSAPSARTEAVVAYARTVHELHRMRLALFGAQVVVAKGYAGGISAGDFPDWAERTISEYAGETVKSTRSRRLVESVKIVFDEVSTAYSQGSPPGMATGHFEYDDLTVGGLHRDELTLVAARPGMGKSALVDCWGVNVASTIPRLFDDANAIAKRQGVILFSVEMPHGQITRRMLAAHSMVTLARLRSGQVEDSDWPALTRSADHLASLPIVIDDTPGLQVETLVARVKRVKREFEREGIELFMVGVDYIQRMQTRGRASSEDQRIGIISNTLDQLAKEEHLAVVAAAQLNRDVEAKQNKRPGLADLRGSGSLEQDADNIVFIYRPEVYGEKVDEKDHGLAELILAKQRNGSTGTVKVRFRGGYTKFENL